MDIKFAGSNENQSGQRFLDSSAPRLIQQVASCETAGGDVAPLAGAAFPPAGKDQKLSWGLGGNAPDVSGVSPDGLCSPEVSDVWALPCLPGSSVPLTAGVTAETPGAFFIGATDGAGLFSGVKPDGLSSLDSLKNNRNTGTIPVHYQRPKGRGTFCGRWSVQGVDPKSGRKIFRRVNCKSWNCSYCGPRRARTARAAIRRVAEDLGLKYFLTLTLDPSKLEDKKYAVPYLRECFNKFRLYLKRRFGVAPNYICVLEFTQAGIPHLHVLFDRFIDQKWISRTWDSLGGGRIVFIKQVTVRNVARYLSKYFTKELLLSAPKGTRRITTARSIKLFPKFNSGIAWELLKESIWRARESAEMAHYEFRRDLFLFESAASGLREGAVRGRIDDQFDEENFLNAFVIVVDV
jgi:hypothetical protein